MICDAHKLKYLPLTVAAMLLSGITIAAQPETGAATKEQQMSAGEAVFNSNCSVCHQPSGAGLPNVFPPLAKSDFLMADIPRAIGIVLYGKSGPVTVNGNGFDSVMPPMGQLSDEQLANVLTYVTNSWGNSGASIAAAQVRELRTLAKAQ